MKWINEFVRVVANLGLNWIYYGLLCLIFGAGSIGRCVALDSTSGGSCVRVAMGLHSIGWGHMDCRVSLCLLLLVLAY